MKRETRAHLDSNGWKSSKTPLLHLPFIYCICLLLNNDLAALIQSFASAGELQNGALETA
jgi:hypothetical protein